MQANSSKRSHRSASNTWLTILGGVCLLLFLGGDALADGPVRDVVADSAKVVEGATDATVDVAEDGTALATGTVEGATIEAGDTAVGTAEIAADETAAAGAGAANSAVTRAGKVPTGIAAGTSKAVGAPPGD